VGARVIEGMQMSVYTRHVHFGSRDIEHMHVARRNILRGTNPYQHRFFS
jgi:hypothetical protein